MMSLIHEWVWSWWSLMHLFSLLLLVLLKWHAQKCKLTTSYYWIKQTIRSDTSTLNLLAKCKWEHLWHKYSKSLGKCSYPQAIGHFAHSPCLIISPDFMKTLKDVTVDYLNNDLFPKDCKSAGKHADLQLTGWRPWVLFACDSSSLRVS